MNFWTVMLAVWAAIFIDNFLGRIVNIVADLHRSRKKKKVVVVNSDPRPVTYKEYNENYLQSEKILKQLKTTKRECELLLEQMTGTCMKMIETKEELEKLAKETPKKEWDDYNGCTGEDWIDAWEKDAKDRSAP